MDIAGYNTSSLPMQEIVGAKRYFCYMALKSIRIENFKSIGDIEIVNPQPFSVLVGANASGKSNIFAALQFLHHLSGSYYEVVLGWFGGKNQLCHLLKDGKDFSVSVQFASSEFSTKFSYGSDSQIQTIPESTFNNFVIASGLNGFRHELVKDEEAKLFVFNFVKIFIHEEKSGLPAFVDDSKLAPDTSNLEKVLKRILNDSEINEEFIETLQLFIPGLDKVEVTSSDLSSRLDLLVYEKALNRPITKDLISDGTYNIIAILTALYQSKSPQFLCIEEPENGLNPKVVKSLVGLCRDLCEDYGHYIWLNTHSQSLVSQLKQEEIILVDKIDGFTQIKQFKEGDIPDMPMDEAWLTNSLGGGLPW